VMMTTDIVMFVLICQSPSLPVMQQGVAVA